MTPFTSQALEECENEFGPFIRTLDIEGDSDAWMEKLKLFLQSKLEEAYQKGLKDGYTKYIDEDKKAQDKLLKGFKHD